MATAREIRVAPISAADGNACIKRHHYSGKIVQNSQLHLGIYLAGRLEGAMQFGPSLDKRKLQALVRGTSWNGFIELNRLAFSDALPRNSESRALGVALRLMRSHYPHLQWIVSFADGAQCGDGTIYRAAGFTLTGIKRNTQVWASPTGDQVVSRTTVTGGVHSAAANGAASMRAYKNAGWEPIEGYQLRYVYFLDPTARARLTVPILPFSKIDELGAGMYRGQARVKQATGPNPGPGGGAAPTDALQIPAAAE
jgi:hypothetical protein